MHHNFMIVSHSFHQSVALGVNFWPTLYVHGHYETSSVKLVEWLIASGRGRSVGSIEKKKQTLTDA